MFGKGLIKIIGLIIAGAIALAAGAQLLASVVSVVLSFRNGNPFPLLGAILFTVVLLRLLQRQHEDTPAKLLLNIAAYAATGYVVVVAFVIALPYGLVASVLAAVFTSASCSILGNLSSVIKQIHEIIPGATLGTRIDGLTKRLVPVGDGTSFAVNAEHTVILVDHSQHDKVVKLMRDRPLLPISLSHFEECDTLFITTDDIALVNRVYSLLNDVDIKTSAAPPLLAEAVQMIPIIDEQNGLPMHDYRLARDKKSVSDLLSTWPLRMIVFPSELEVMILVPDNVSTGLNVEKLKQGHESEILLNRNFTSLREVSLAVESTT